MPTHDDLSVSIEVVENWVHGRNSSILVEGRLLEDNRLGGIAQCLDRPTYLISRRGKLCHRLSLVY